MKNKLIIPTLMILLSTLIIAIFPTDAESAIYDDTIRLHILANSDSEEDQMLKISLRDAILNEYSDELSKSATIEDATLLTENLLPQIESFAKEKIKDEGYDYDVRVTLTEEWYDTREYENFRLPKGYYNSLQVIIGNGEGKNWWCVMFPPLCLDASTEKIAYSPEEELLITKKYAVKFKIIEVVSEIWK